MSVEQNIKRGKYNNHAEYGTKERKEEDYRLKIMFRHDLEVENRVEHLPVAILDRTFQFCHDPVWNFDSARTLEDTTRRYAEVADLVEYAHVVGWRRQEVNPR